MTGSVGRTVLWWLCLGAAPAILIAIELYHPAGFTADPGMYAYLSQAEPHTGAHHALDYFGPGWWFTLHMIQTPMVGLVAIGLWLMLADTEAAAAGAARPWAIAAAWLARVATFVFAVYYTVLDAIGGIGLARLIEITETLAAAPPDAPHLSAAQRDGAILLLDTFWTDEWAGGVGSVISQTGSWAVFVAALAAALLVGFGWCLQLSHASYTGPLAFALLLVAALWMWVAGPRRV